MGAKHRVWADRRKYAQLLVLAVAAGVVACSVKPVNFAGLPVSLGGTTTGVVGTGLVLTNNGGDDLAISGDGSFTFTTAMEPGTAYSVEVTTQPSNPTQMCSVVNGKGTVRDRDVIDIQVSCQTTAFSVGGIVSGLVGSGLVLQVNGGDDLAIGGDGSFAFATPVASGARFEVTVLTQPTQPTQICEVVGGTGTIGSDDVVSVAVECAPTNAFTIGGTLSGLADGNSITLRNNGGNELIRATNGSFTFSTPIATEQAYAVTIVANPESPVSQTCSVENGAGMVTGGPITNVTITCTTNPFTIGGTLSGLASGNSVIVRNNGGDTVTRSANGNFTFATQVASGQPYAVTVVNPTAPISQSCTVSNGAGTVGNTNVTVAITCTTNTFTIGGTVSGLSGSGLVLQNNGSTLSISGNGAFTFGTRVASGASYNVTIASQTSTPCSVVAGTGSGTVGNANVTSVAVSCGCGNGTVDPGEERDPPPGPFVNAPVDSATCRWHFENVSQLYCNAGCSWAGASGCDQADADILCKLRTGNPNSTATTFELTTALALPGFACIGSAGIGTLPLRGVLLNVAYQDSSILANHGPGAVVANPVCTNP